MVSDQQLALMMPRNQAEIKLNEQIEKGNELLNMHVENHDQFLQFQSKHKKWDKFNSDLLKVIFTNFLIVNEYHFSTKEHSERQQFSIELMLNDLATSLEAQREHIRIQIACLESIVERLELYSVSQANSSNNGYTQLSVDRNKIFIVHGHDNEVKQEVARFIEKLGFEPIVLHEQASSGNTLIEKIEEFSDVGFGIALYTPCDIGSKKTGSPNPLNRARQNVVFEHGYLIGKLGRKNVCALVKGEIEKPNDISGVVYISLEDGHWKIGLAKELKASGYEVDMNKVV